MNMLFAKAMFSMLSPAGPRARLTTFLFHKVPVTADPLTDNELDLAHFERILDFLTEHANIVPLGEASAALARGTLPERAVALTFDDGYAEWVGNVAPVLLRRKLPATFFVTTGQLSGSSALWHERIISAVRALPDKGVALPYGFGNYIDLAQPQRRAQLIEDLQRRLKYASVDERVSAIALLESQAVRELILPSSFDANSVRTLHSLGFEIGAHTVQHPILNECTAAQARAEIGGCKEDLEAIIGGKVKLFAYPNGRPQEDYTHEHVAMVKACGYQAAVATSGGAAGRDSDVFQLPRFTPWGASDARFTYQLTRNILTPARYARPQDDSASSNVRCMLIASTFPPIHGGSAVVYGNLCQHMPKDSIRVLAARDNYLSAKEIDGWREHDAAVAYPVDRIPLLRPLMAPPPANSLVSIWRLLVQDLPLYASVLLTAGMLVYKHRINVVCVGELVTGSWLGIALKKLFGCKLIIYVHGEEITTATSGFHGNRRRDYLAAADKVIAVSSFTCDALTQQMNVRPEAIALIQNGVDTERFTPGAPDPAIIARHNLQGKKVLLTVGRLVPRKGADMAMEAMAMIRAARPDVHYLIIGEGELRLALEKMIEHSGLADCVTLVGKASEQDLIPYLRSCDLFLMPNRTMPDGDTEGFGLVFREANACRKPVVGGRAGGVVEAVVHGQTGYLVDGTDPQAIADGVLAILNNAELAEQMSARGLQLARDNNTVSVARQFLTVCERLLNERRSVPAAQVP